jgi:predicted permease
MNFTVILSALAVGLLNFGDRPAFISSIFFIITALAMMVYSLFIYHWRAQSIRKKGQAGFDDKIGPTVLAILLSIAIAINFILRVIAWGKEN